MAAITGKSGTVLYSGGSVATINSWSLDVDTNMHDVTSFTTDVLQWREFVAGLSGFTGSLSGTFNPDSTGQNNLITNTLTPVAAAVVLELDKVAGGSLSGSVFLQSMSLGSDIDATSDASWSLQGTGALAFSTST
jgi:hypothetical protein